MKQIYTARQPNIRLRPSDRVKKSRRIEIRAIRHRVTVTKGGVVDDEPVAIDVTNSNNETGAEVEAYTAEDREILIETIRILERIVDAKT